ncbi:hypothetical protein Cni_G27309 [Canna indica]|uniref:Uncharacterized protein n=1 Tax=Canna indica TaxID=4628 RepID=A0AAQ3L7L7_9LILI|nr:hypothetical protein Cni_G27309 [Canna indica]
MTMLGSIAVFFEYHLGFFSLSSLCSVGFLVHWFGLEERAVGMVCQAATQTRFRALKHETGIAGSTTIIVRVIACFQPLQDCQVKLEDTWPAVL